MMGERLSGFGVCMIIALTVALTLLTSIAWHEAFLVVVGVVVLVAML